MRSFIAAEFCLHLQQGRLRNKAQSQISIFCYRKDITGYLFVSVGRNKSRSNIDRSHVRVLYNIIHMSVGFAYMHVAINKSNLRDIDLFLLCNLTHLPDLCVHCVSGCCGCHDDSSNECVAAANGEMNERVSSNALRRRRQDDAVGIYINRDTYTILLRTFGKIGKREKGVRRAGTLQLPGVCFNSSYCVVDAC